MVAPFPAPDALKALLAGLLGLELENRQLGGLNPGALKQARFSGFGDVLLALSRARPVLLAIEDLHWIDAGSAEWLAGFCHRLFLAAPGDGLLVLATVREGELEPPLAGARAAYTRSLELRELCGDLEGAANTHNNLGALFGVLAEPEEAERHFGRALGIYTKLGHRLGVVRSWPQGCRRKPRRFRGNFPFVCGGPEMQGRQDHGLVASWLWVALVALQAAATQGYMLS